MDGRVGEPVLVVMHLLSRTIVMMSFKRRMRLLFDEVHEGRIVRLKKLASTDNTQ